MDQQYELYERRSNGVLNWRGMVNGLDGARVTVQLLTDETDNECFAARVGTSQPVLIRTPAHGGRRVLQIAYGPQIRTRAALLRHQGYDVTSVWGNAAAALMLRARLTYDLFIIGAETEMSTRLEIADQLHRRYPRTSIIMLGPADDHGLDGVPCNAGSENSVASS